MRTKFWANNILLTEMSNKEKMDIRRTCIGVQVVNDYFKIDNNMFNRVYLGIFDEPKHVKRDDINPKARDYQKKDVEAMLSREHVLNRNKPGYGKTFETIEYCRLLGLKRILIICPKSVTTQWKQQFKLWWPEVEPNVVVGGDGPKRGEKSIFVTNYEQLTFRNIAPKGSRMKQLQPSQVWQRCKEWVWDVIICDESHRIKNPQAQVTKAIKQLPSIRRVALTGTPVLNHPDDLWSQLHFLDPEIAGRNYWNFVNRFCEVEDGHFGKKIIGVTPSSSAKDLLSKTLSLISVGGHNHNVTAGKNKIDIELEMDHAQKKLYRQTTNLVIDDLNKQGITVKNAMDQMVKLQLISTNCQSFKSVDEQGVEKIICPRNPKFEWVKDWLEDNEEKVVVFTKFAKAAKELNKYLEKNKINSVLYIGEMSEKTRTASKEKFGQYNAVRVLIGTIGALGTGVDGLQHVCNNVIFLDRDWTPGINEQAEQRVDRSGQKDMTNIWLLSMKGSVDKYVENMINKKAEDIEEVFKNVRTGFGSWE